MQAISSYSRRRRRKDGFDKIPGPPKRVYLLQANPLLYHLPTKLATHKRDTWRLPSMTEDMCEGDAVILWQGGPQAGIYGIAVPYGERFETTHYPEHRKTSRNFEYMTYCIKLQYVYVLARPLLHTTLKECRDFLVYSRIRRGIECPGYRIELKEWKTIYELLWQSREAEFLAREAADPETLAHQVWPVLTHAAAEKSLVDPLVLSEQFNAHPVQIQDCLDLIANVCGSENWPPLASIIRKNDPSADSRGLPGSNVLSTADFQALPQPENSFTEIFDWKSIANPFEFVLEATTDQLVQRLVDNPSPQESADIYKLIKVRGTAQQVFAKMMRRIYDNQCAFCGFSIAPALEAAHIKPWVMCTAAERLLPSNGLLLCGVHHKLFDAGLMTLSDNHIIRVFSPESLTYIAKADDQYILDLDGTKAHVPLFSGHLPSPEFLKFRAELVAQLFGRGADDLRTVS
jgi:putative restriction endonuclease